MMGDDPDKIRRRFRDYKTDEEAAREFELSQEREAQAKYESRVKHSNLLYQVLSTALPLLRKNAQPQAIPIEVEHGLLIRHISVKAGWMVIKKATAPGMGTSPSDTQPSEESFFILTEEGKIGWGEEEGANKVIRVNEIHDLDPKAIREIVDPDILDYSHRMQRDWIAWEYAYETISDILKESGTPFPKPEEHLT